MNRKAFSVIVLLVTALFVLGAGYTSLIYFGPGRNEMFVKSGGQITVESGGEVEIESGGAIDVESGAALKLAGTAITSTAAELNKLAGVTATTAELNVVDGKATGFFFGGAAGGANVAEITIRALDAAGTAYRTEPFLMHVWLSDNAEGIGLTGTTASGTVQAKSGGSYSDLQAITAKKHLLVQTDTDGKYILEITDTAKTGFYVGACLLGSMAEPDASAQLASASFGPYGA